jgi:hypothetical protein
MTTEEPNDKTISADGTMPADENHWMQAFIDEERATNAEPWWQRSPWSGKDQSYWDLNEISFLKHEYDTANNPLYVWAALQVVMNLPEPSPDQVKLFRETRRWIDEYLNDSANRLMEMVKSPPSTDVGNEIAKALKFTFDRGKGSPFSEMRKELRNRQLGLEVWRRLRAERYKEMLAVEYVANANGLGKTVVGDAWREFKKAAPR